MPRFLGAIALKRLLEYGGIGGEILEYAEFIVVSEDVKKAIPKEILNSEVLQTVVGGRMVYQKK
jgi:hypothetical protein